MILEMEVELAMRRLKERSTPHDARTPELQASLPAEEEGL
jgi:hypothetical protein